ncbi:MAG: hypothetical protein IT436_13630 [Phycisphaerales bacterium]|nr:hypothetical protein [Phycisphaerales bacterium]
MSQPARMIFVAVLFASALIASSFLLRKSGAGEWVDAGLYLAAGCWLALQVTTGLKAPRGRACLPRSSS